MAHTPKEKAEELVRKFLEVPDSQFSDDGNLMFEVEAKQCAIIAVDEIIKSNPTNPLKSGYIEIYSDMIDQSIEYWQQVKIEIEKL